MATATMMSRTLMRRCTSATSIARSYTRRVVEQQRLFSSGDPPHDEELTDWIPPNRPLAGDKGRSDLYDTSTAGEDEVVPEEEEVIEAEEDTSMTIDWLSTRREKHAAEASSMDMPDRNRKFAGAELEILEGRLLSSDEVEQCLTSMGCVDYRLIELTEERQQQRIVGVKGIIIVTATSTRHLRLLSDTLVRQLKIRKLASKGVVGAALGAEGGHDWRVVDCRNYIVHLMLEQTRQHVNLEALWTGEDELLSINYNDEDAVDEYVANNPVPPGFGQVQVQEISDTVSQLQRWNMGHKAVIHKPKRKHGNKKRGPRLL
jgi:ribosomal silencing factor RsfS